MGYCTVTEVLNRAGLSLARIEELEEGNLTSAQITAMIEDYIEDNDQDIKDKLGIPVLVKDEVHIADGETSEFTLGPSDEEHYTYENVEGNVEDVIHCYFGTLCPNNRKLHPYPADCDDFITEDDAVWTETSNCTVSNDTSIYRVGIESVKMIFAASGYARAVLGSPYAVEIPIDQFGYVAFLFRSTDATPTFTLYLYDVDGNANTQTFTVAHANEWYIIWIRLNNMTGTINWEDKKLHKIAIYANAACTVYLDNFNFNDGYCWEAPLGKLYIHEADNAGEEPPVEGTKFYVVYRFDQYKHSADISADIRKASTLLSAADLIDHMINVRQAHIGFEAEASTGVPNMDKEGLNYSSTKMRKRAEEILAAIGYGFEFGVVKGN